MMKQPNALGQPAILTDSTHSGDNQLGTAQVYGAVGYTSLVIANYHTRSCNAAFSMQDLRIG